MLPIGMTDGLTITVGAMNTSSDASCKPLRQPPPLKRLDNEIDERPSFRR
jgi:hypothetical protein